MPDHEFFNMNFGIPSRNPLDDATFLLRSVQEFLKNLDGPRIRSKDDVREILAAHVRVGKPGVEITEFIRTWLREEDRSFVFSHPLK